MPEAMMWTMATGCPAGRKRVMAQTILSATGICEKKNTPGIFIPGAFFMLQNKNIRLSEDHQCWFHDSDGFQPSTDWKLY